jgi:DNA replication protein DnaC
MITIQRKNRYQNVLFKDCIVDETNKEVLTYLKSYLKNIEQRISDCENVIICGELGVGKTMMVKALQNELKGTKVREEIKNGKWNYETKTAEDMIVDRLIKTEFISCQNLIKALREHFKKGVEENMDYHNCDLLVVDEVGVQYGTDNEKLALNDLFNYRYENYKPTFIISNKELYADKYKGEKDVSNVLGFRIIDRIDSGSSKYFYINAKSKRRGR